jgi:hypothetical protein
MPVSQVVITTPIPENVFTDPSIGTIVDSVKTSNGTVYYITVDNSLNLLVPSYVKLFFAIPANVTVGVTVPNEILFISAGSKETRKYMTGVNFGKVFPVALSAICVTGSISSSTTPPTNPVSIRISYM